MVANSRSIDGGLDGICRRAIAKEVIGQLWLFHDPAILFPKTTKLNRRALHLASVSRLHLQSLQNRGEIDDIDRRRPAFHLV